MLNHEITRFPGTARNHLTEIEYECSSIILKIQEFFMNKSNLTVNSRKNEVFTKRRFEKYFRKKLFAVYM